MIAGFGDACEECDEGVGVSGLAEDWSGIASPNVLREWIEESEGGRLAGKMSLGTSLL